ncbi:PEP-CTERM domain protein [Nostoc minutum NIES-26]|uniref:PEP-CTERM domain protein n=1 Tax=Nostoc minutum NIES-26 TaxID=1844469 RepID=A0A367QAM7_9NOSO|nr:PEP-CTERM sorting domain-containing protein [Dendronalium sp. ChiSLP03b]MDZ8208934.1 PEP-CTERM sorting domain-containing protein [Dendronalium sp. ChiSLP03b]RCJ20354.1 PEP-CTERM domain protein [Nostoc minutum NIES-26]
MKLAKNFGVATVAVAISVAAGAIPTQAAVVNYDFMVNAIAGDYPGQYYGSFSYDDSTLTGTGEETLGINNGLSIAFNYLGIKYTEKNDIDYGYGAPFVSFQNGNLLGINYLVEDRFFIGSNPENLNTGGAKFYSIVSADLTSATQVGTVSYSQVPEPMTLGGTVVTGTLGLWLKRKKKAPAVAK